MHSSRQATTFALTPLCVATLLASSITTGVSANPLEPTDTNLFTKEAIKDGAKSGVFVDMYHPFQYNQRSKTWQPIVDQSELIRAGIHHAFFPCAMIEFCVPPPLEPILVGEGLEHLIIRTSQGTLDRHPTRLVRFGIFNSSISTTPAQLKFDAPTYISLEGNTISWPQLKLIGAGVFQDVVPSKLKTSGTNATISFNDLFIKADGLNLTEDHAGMVAGVHNASESNTETSFEANNLWVGFASQYDTPKLQNKGDIELVGFHADNAVGSNVINGRMRVIFGDVQANDPLTRQGIKVVNSKFVLKGDLDAGSVGSTQDSAVIVAAGTKTNADTTIDINQASWDHAGEKFLLVTGPSTINLAENANLIKGDIVERLKVDQKPIVNLNFKGENQGFEGAIKVEGAGVAEHNFKFANGAHWTIHGENPLATINRLNLDNGTMRFNNTQSMHKLLVNDFHADNDSVVFMNMDVAGKNNDQLEISDQASGHLKVSIALANDNNADQTYTNWLIKTPSNANLSVTNPEGGYSFANNAWHLALVEDVTEEALKNAKPFDKTQPVHGGYWVLIKDQPKNDQTAELVTEPKHEDQEEPTTPDVTDRNKTDENGGTDKTDTDNTDTTGGNDDSGNTGGNGDHTPTPDTDTNSSHVADGQNGNTTKTPEEVLVNLASSAAMGSLWFSDLNDVRLRVGEIRQGKGDGIWTTFTTETERFSRHGQPVVKSHAQQVSIGLDHQIQTNYGDWIVGAALKQSASRAHGLHDAQGARVKSRSVSLKAYSTLVMNSGAYVDVVAQVGYNRQELNGTANDATNGFAATYRQWGVGASVEVGHQLALARDGQNPTWFVEPQMQLSVYHVPSKAFTTSTGLHAAMDAVNFITGRVGMVFGHHALKTDTQQLEWGAIAGLKYEFLGKQDVTYTDKNVAHTREALNMRGARVYYGLEGSYQAGNHWRMYGTIQREDGHNYHKSYRLDLGMRWAF